MMCLRPFLVNGNLASCGKCIECRIRKANEWSFRIADEAKIYKDNCMLSLTYSDENLPSDNSVSVRELQLFVKRLRKHCGKNHLIRYFGCGEYGKRYGRPHYHIIVFNWKPADLQFLFLSDSGHDVYISDEVYKLWKKGFITVVDVTKDTAKYVAKYLQKKVNDGRKEAFTIMSRKPAIGTMNISKSSIDDDRIYVDGKSHILPRAYLNTLAKTCFAKRVEEIKEARKNNLKKMYAKEYGEAFFDIDLILQSARKRSYKLKSAFKSSFCVFDTGFDSGSKFKAERAMINLLRNQEKINGKLAEGLINLVGKPPTKECE